MTKKKVQPQETVEETPVAAEAEAPVGEIAPVETPPAAAEIPVEPTPAAEPPVETPAPVKETPPVEVAAPAPEPESTPAPEPEPAPTPQPEPASEKAGTSDPLADGQAAVARGDFATAQNAYTQALQRAADAQERAGMAVGYEALGIVAMMQAEYDTAYTHYTKALALFRELADAANEATIAQQLTLLRRLTGKP